MCNWTVGVTYLHNPLEVVVREGCMITDRPLFTTIVIINNDNNNNDNNDYTLL